MSLSYGTILLIIALILLPFAIAFYYRRSRNQSTNDPRRGLTPNATNYNLKGIIEDSVIENASREQIQEIIDKIKKGDLPSLSNEDYFRLQRRLNSFTTKEA